MPFQIKKKERNYRLGIFILGVGSYYLASELLIPWLNTNFPTTNPLLIGGAIFLAGLYFFDL
jgi:hypothetical protein